MRVSYKHTFSAGHRLVNHPGECRMIHGHNYVVTLTVDGPIVNDMVIDFAELKPIAKWIDKNWDHRLLLWDQDPILNEMVELCQKYETIGSVCAVPFNPTAENMALFLLERFGLSAVTVQETEKCSATVDSGKQEA